MSTSIHYQISFEQTNAHLFNITLDIPVHSPKSLKISLPSWIPGSYMVRDFAKNIVNIAAFQQQKPIELTALDKQSWQLNTQGKASQIQYQVYAFDTSVRTAYLDNTRGFFNGTSVFLQVEGFEESKQLVSLIKPDLDWKVATGLKRSSATPKYHFGEYYADNYAELIDCPVEITDFTAVEFEVAGTPHHLILSGKQYADLARVKQDLTKLCQHHIDLFEKETGGKPPFSEYWFLTNILPSGFGGLEHKNSTALLCSTFDFPNINKPDELSEGYKTFLSLVSHEYFHNWNVCRIKPEEFVPYRLNRESYTKQLWAFEGITSYYDDLSLFRTGIISFEDYLKLKSQTISRVNRGKGQLKQNLIESSFYTWTKFYQQGPDAVNNIVSYYTKGSLLALWLDLTVRKATNATKSLDDVMRALWADFVDKGADYKGTQLDTIINIVNSLILSGTTASDAHSTHIRETFYQLLNNKAPIPLAELLADFGVELKQVPSKAASLLETSSDAHSPYLGFMFKESKLGIEVMQVLEDSPAEKAGISVQDNIIAIDNIVVSKANFANVVNNLALNHDYTVSYIRNGELFNSVIQLSDAVNELSQMTVIDAEKAKSWQAIV
ncbi:PDZ domain-containing protein [Catenovulum sp. 2E275]|uniref:M61 family metallopeptidase n=1 Tax=Catenovulum sp. 2E275 TaxID=2980497 RepID=UPI0021D30646|nr:PDZ domain-containing protein [Catenovulum sp. 2E275]MCU4676504.1 PDZ domain-containing protein [Catenovulum sp. 2E275]